MFLFYVRSDNFLCSSSSVILAVTASQITDKQFSTSHLICTFTFFPLFHWNVKSLQLSQLSLGIRSNSGRPPWNWGQFLGLYCRGLLTPGICGQTEQDQLFEAAAKSRQTCFSGFLFPSLSLFYQLGKTH